MKLPYNYVISIKSTFGVEFRRYALSMEYVSSFDKFYKQIENLHQLASIPFVIHYPDSDGFYLPINNDDNLAKAINSAKQITLYNTNYNNYPTSSSNSTPTHNYNFNYLMNNNNYLINNDLHYNNHEQINTTSTITKRPYLKLLIKRKSEFLDSYNGNLTGKYKKGKGFLVSNPNVEQTRPSISVPEDFRQVSSIIDVDIVPETCRRVRIVKHGSDRPLGFYIRDGTYRRMNASGQIELVTGVFISKLVEGGLAESTGLLAVNDEVLEVNGMQVTHGKTLDQVTDMMVANSSNLILTIKTNHWTK